MVGERALGLTSDAFFTLQHCDQPMTWKESNTTWSGPPGDGVQNNLATYTCETCGAVASITLTEPC